MEPQDLFAFLREKVELFKDFPEPRLKELLAGSRVTTFEGNEAVIEFGEEGRFLGVLITGQAEAAVTDNTGARCASTFLKRAAFSAKCRL